MTVRGDGGRHHEQFRHAGRQPVLVSGECDDLVDAGGGGQQDQGQRPLSRVGVPAGTGD